MATVKAFSPIYFATFCEINFEKYDPQKVLVLLYLFVHCKSGDFFVTLSKFKTELGINKGILSRITGELKEDGLITFETKGFSNSTHYRVDYKKMASKAFLEGFFKSKEIANEYLPYFQEIAKKSVLKQTTKTRGVITIDPSLKQIIENVRVACQSSYNEARKKAPIEGDFKGFGSDWAKLPFSKVHQQKVSKLLSQEYTAKNISEAFRAFILHHYQRPERERNQITNPVSYFFKEKSGDFPVVSLWLNYYNERFAQR